jgi:DNA-directed RNA polymerase specialized sigma24 family protein
VVLHYLLGLDVQATARVLNISEGTVKTGLFRARAALAARLGDLDAEEDMR